MKTIKMFVPILLLNFVSAQFLYVNNMRFTIKEGQEQKALDQISKKTKTYNNEGGMYKLYTYQIMTGPNFRHYVRSRRLNGLKDLDVWDTKGREYWGKHVMPRVNMEERLIGQFHPEFSVNNTGNTEPTNFLQIWTYSVDPSKINQFLDVWNKFKSGNEKVKNPKTRYGLFSTVSGGNRGDYVLVSYFDSWAELDELNATNQSNFDKANGSGSFQKLVGQLFSTLVSSSDSRNSEIWRFVPELSSDR